MKSEVLRNIFIPDSSLFNFSSHFLQRFVFYRTFATEWVLSHCSTSVLRHIIFEALCSFLQGENVRNFQNYRILRKFVSHELHEVREDEHSGFTYYAWNCLLTIFFFSGNSDDPHLEDVDIQFHASFVC